MKKRSILILIVIALGVVIVSSLIIFINKKSGQKQFLSKPQASDQTTKQTNTDQQIIQEDYNLPAQEDKPLLLKSIGIDLDYYNPATQRAGDFKFTRQDVPFDSIFQDYGFVIPASSSATGKAKVNPQPSFIVPLGTKVHSLVDGVIINVAKLYSNDYSIQVARDKNSRWIYETEHVIKPVVEEGDTVRAGQVIAEVTDFDERYHEGFGMVEIGILHPTEQTPQHVCPFYYLDPSIKKETLSRIRAFYKAWEEYRGDNTIYDESGLAQPGCLTLDPISG